MISTVSRESAPRSTNLESAATCGGEAEKEGKAGAKGEKEGKEKRSKKGRRRRSLSLSLSSFLETARKRLLALFLLSFSLLTR